MAADDIGRLFLEPPGRFVQARDALAKELRAAGDKDRAAEVKQLRRPTAAAWAVDQLARRRPKDVEKLLAAGEALREAHAAAMSGSGAADLRAAAEAERAAVDGLTDDARTLLEEAELASETTMERVRATLHGAASDEDLREQIREGRLARDRAAVGLGEGGAEAVAPAAPAPKARRTGRGGTTKAKSQREDAAKRERERRHEEERRARERSAEEKRRRDAITKAEKHVEQAERRLQDARAEVERRERDLDAARKRLEDTR